MSATLMPCRTAIWIVETMTDAKFEIQTAADQAFTTIYCEGIGLEGRFKDAMIDSIE